jgi:leucyl-tRNA synthetase
MRITSAVPYEEKWLRRWEEDKIFYADPDPRRPKVFVTFPYSYQNGPLHIGHGFTATRGDIYARYKRMKGFNVLFPWAWHWTGEAVAGTSERLKKGDQTVIRVLRDVDKVPEEVLPTFTVPENICRYYTEENRRVAKAMGFSVDWRREFYTSDLHPYYSRFVEWQYRTLQRLGKLRKGSHPVVWCPACESPTGDHDRLVGEGVSPIEFTLVYFKLEDDEAHLAASTLRPETIFGATNLWIRPEANYMEVMLDNTRVIVSSESYDKLRNQVKSIKHLRNLHGSELIGRYCVAPITGMRLIVLPAEFVDPATGTGVVYSVPSHAPYDYAGLKELKGRADRLREFGVDPAILEGLTPINIIDTVGLGPSPAIEMVEREGISSSTDPRLERLTKELYSKEFYEGVLNDRCGEFAGLSVKDARDNVKGRLLRMGLGGTLYDLPEPVICRSGDRCIVKIVEDQWFIAYGDEEWKTMVREYVERELHVFPENARQWFLNVIDWLKNWPCTRKTGLGTKFPFDEKWIVETLSDSTVYPALYTVSRYLNDGTVNPHQLTPQLLDFVFRGEGDPAQISRELQIEKSVLEAMRSEFDYWYPVDLRVSAKDLLPNHLTFYIFQHAALFPRQKWPRAISVNGMVRIEGEEMHKSRGNFVSLKDAISRVGADATRLAIILAAEDMDDPDWRWKNAEDLRRYLDNFLKLVSDLYRREHDSSWEEADLWALTRCQHIIREVEESLEKLKTRTAASKVLYDMENLVKKYLRRKTGALGPAIKELLEAWVLMLVPLAPFTAEEAWHQMGKEGYASLSSWPSFAEKFDQQLLLRDELLEMVLSDVRNIRRVMQQEPREALLFIAPSWMTKILEECLTGAERREQALIGMIARRLVRHLRLPAASIQTLARKILETVQDLSSRYSVDTILKVAGQEEEVYRANIRYLEQELGMTVSLRAAESELDDSVARQKALQATPLRPGIYLIA